MLVLNGNKVQYCPNQSHDGVWGEGTKAPPTPKLWPLQFFAAAVDKWRTMGRTAGEAALPDLNIDLGGL